MQVVLKLFVFVCLLGVQYVNGFCSEYNCQQSSSYNTRCCENDDCCPEWEYESEQLAGVCYESTCQLFSSINTRCCENGDCCPEWEYESEQQYNTITFGIGAIIATVVGSIILIVLCIIGCVCCCCRPNRSNPGAVVHATTVSAGVPVQQYPPGYQYPPGQQYPPGVYPPTQQYPQFTQPANNPAAEQPYSNKNPNMISPPTYQ